MKYFCECENDNCLAVFEMEEVSVEFNKPNRCCYCGESSLKIREDSDDDIGNFGPYDDEGTDDYISSNTGGDDLDEEGWEEDDNEDDDENESIDDDDNIIG